MNILLILAIPFFLRLCFCISVAECLKALPFIIKDKILYVKNREWRKFKEFGIELYLGTFGSGKSISIVRRLLYYHRIYPDVPIYSNVELYGISYIPLTSFQQVVDLDSQAIVFIDEIGMNFNSREFGKFPMALLDNILQCRHIGLLILGTAQDFDDVDIILRRHISWIHEVKNLGKRLIGVDSYSGYRAYHSNVDYHNIRPDKRSIFYSVSDKLRNSYDTNKLAVNIKNVVDDETYTSRHAAAATSTMVNRYNRKYSPKKYSTGVK